MSLVKKGQHVYCPYCKLITEQMRVSRGVRRCMGCGKEFTIKAGRQAEKERV
jgi:transposase-like protein